MSKEEILDKHYQKKMHWDAVNRKNVLHAMDEYALEEMTRLVRNMQVRPIECFSQKVKGQDKQYFLGRSFIENLVVALKQQYQSQNQSINNK